MRVAVLAVAGVLGAPAVGQADVTFDRAFGWGVDTAGGAFENCTTASTCQAGFASDSAGAIRSPTGVAVDARGGILVGDVNRISRFVVAGDGTVSFDRAFGIGVDTGGFAFENCTTVTGCAPAPTSSAAGGMAGPQGVAVDPQGRILVADAGNHRIDRFAVAADGTVSFDRAFGIGVDTGAAAFESCTTATGCQAGAPGIPSRPAGGMWEPSGLAIDARGRILVTDSRNHRVNVYAVAGDGTLSFDRAFGLGVDTGALFVENCTTASGCQDGFPSDDAGGMVNPDGIAVDGHGRILVSDTGNARIDRFTVGFDGTVRFDLAFGLGVRTGAPALEHCTDLTGCQAGSGTAAAGDMEVPRGIAVDAQGNILVASQFNDRIDRFAVAGSGVRFDRGFGLAVATGTAVFENCTTATGCQEGGGVHAGGVKDPIGVAVDQQGRILVADSDNRRIDRFSPGPTVTVTTVLAPATDPGTFDLRVDGVVVRAAAAHGQSGSLQVADGAGVTISEQAVAGQLTDYDTTIDCGGGPQPGTSLTVTVTANLSCTITNTRRGAQPPIDTSPPRDTSAPAIAAASLTNRTFAVDRRGAPEVAVPAAARKGTAFRYTLSEAARVLFTVERATAGRRVGRTCRRRTRSNEQRRRCTRYVRAGRFAQQSAAGANRRPFSGRIGRRSLTPGRYRVTLVATDAAGNRSAARRLSFTVVKR